MSYIRTGGIKIGKIQLSPRINFVPVLGLWGRVSKVSEGKVLGV